MAQLRKEHKNGILNHPKKGIIKLGSAEAKVLTELSKEKGYAHLFVQKKKN